MKKTTFLNLSFLPVRNHELLLRVLFILTLLAASSAPSSAQIPGLPRIPGLRIPNIPGLKIPSISDLIPRPSDEPVTTNIKDIRGEVPFLDSFNPTRFTSLTSLKRGPKGGWLLQPGLYSATIRSYCLHAGTYGPTKGNGYSYAPLKGKRAGVIAKILHNSADHPEIPQPDVQSLIWAIEARTKVSDMPLTLQSAAAALLSAEDVLDLNGASVKFLEDQLIKQAYNKLDALLLPVVKAQNDMRRALTSVVSTPYKQLERIAVLNGDPPKDKNDRDIPGGRWIMRPEGFFERFLPAGYSQTRLEIYVPGQCVIKRDVKGRIISVSDEAGSRVETDYNDAAAPLATTVKNLQGYSFASIRFITPTRKMPREIKNIGWTFTGLPVGKTISVGNAVDFPGSDARLQTAISVLHEMEDFKKQNGKNHKGAWADVSDVVDLASYRDGIEAAYKGARKSGTKPVAMLNQAWQVSMMAWAKNPPVDTTAPSRSAKKKRGPAAPLMLTEQTASNDDGTVAAPPPIEYDPSNDVAVPGSTGRQRLGLSVMPYGNTGGAGTDDADTSPDHSDFKISYRRGTDDFKDAPADLKARLGETVDFKVTFAPATSGEEPDQDIEWGGTSGAAGSEQIVSVKFSEASMTASDFKTVIATSGSAQTVDVMVCRYVLGIHSNVSPSAGLVAGHAWVSLTDFSNDPATTETRGLWPDDDAWIVAHRHPAKDRTDVQINVEMPLPEGIGHGPWSQYQRFYLLDPQQKTNFDKFLAVVRHWTVYKHPSTYDCADFASELTQATTGEKVSARDNLIFGTPRAISGSIEQLEAADPTSLLNPSAGNGQPGDSSSSSFNSKASNAGAKSGKNNGTKPKKK